MTVGGLGCWLFLPVCLRRDLWSTDWEGVSLFEAVLFFPVFVVSRGSWVTLVRVFGVCKLGVFLRVDLGFSLVLIMHIEMRMGENARSFGSKRLCRVVGGLPAGWYYLIPGRSGDLVLV